ncbi:hypothetical protein YA26_11465 [Klebsiella aerogenes]|nr:hypothetical protein YA26_11465 [Klebsiella aerogenes]
MLHDRNIIFSLPVGAINQERQNTLHVDIIKRIAFNRFAVIGDDCLPAYYCKLQEAAQRYQDVTPLLWPDGGIDNGVSGAGFDNPAITINVAQDIGG